MSTWLNPNKVLCIVYVAAMFVVAMDATVLNVAIQTISLELGVPPAVSELWEITAAVLKIRMQPKMR